MPFSSAAYYQACGCCNFCIMFAMSCNFIHFVCCHYCHVCLRKILCSLVFQTILIIFHLLFDGILPFFFFGESFLHNAGKHMALSASSWTVRGTYCFEYTYFKYLLLYRFTDYFKTLYMLYFFKYPKSQLSILIFAFENICFLLLFPVSFPCKYIP